MAEAKMAALDECRQAIRYRDGSIVARMRNFDSKRPRWVAFWADGTPLRGDNDETSYFESPEAAYAAIVAGGEG